MQEKIIPGSIIGIGLVASIALGLINGNLYLTRFEQYRDDAHFYNEKALLLLDQGSLRDDLSYFRKPPLYSAFLAVSYGVFGRRPLSAWITQGLLYAASLLLLYLVCIQFMPRKFAALSMLFYALYWAAGFHVFKISAETLAIFLLLVIVYLGLLFTRVPSKIRVIGWALAYALLTLTKPIVLYSVPLSVGILLWRQSRKNFLLYSSIIAVCYGVLVGGWMLRNQYFFKDYQIEQIGHIVWVKMEISGSSLRDMVAYGTASLVGDYIADHIFPGYADNPLPLSVHRRAKLIWAEKEIDGLSDFEIDSYFLEEGSQNLRRRLVGAMVTSIPSIFELNAPTNHRGFSLAHFLTGTHENIPSWIKVFLIISIRSIWFAILGVVAVGAIQGIKKDPRFLFVVWMIVYFNSMHALIIIPAETRYLAPVIPFYVLCGVYAFWRWRERKYSVS